MGGFHRKYVCNLKDVAVFAVSLSKILTRVGSRIVMPRAERDRTDFTSLK